MQRITIEQLQVPTLIGVYEWERIQKTCLLMTVNLDVDVSVSAFSDNVDDTVDYAAVAEHIKKTAANTEFELLEALGKVICESVISQFPVDKMTLKIEKPNILPDASSVSVAMAFDKHGPVSI